MQNPGNPYQHPNLDLNCNKCAIIYKKGTVHDCLFAIRQECREQMSDQDERIRCLEQIVSDQINLIRQDIPSMISQQIQSLNLNSNSNQNRQGNQGGFPQSQQFNTFDSSALKEVQMSLQTLQNDFGFVRNNQFNDKSEFTGKYESLRQILINHQGDFKFCTAELEKDLRTLQQHVSYLYKKLENTNLVLKTQLSRPQSSAQSTYRGVPDMQRQQQQQVQNQMVHQQNNAAPPIHRQEQQIFQNNQTPSQVQSNSNFGSSQQPTINNDVPRNPITMMTPGYLPSDNERYQSDMNVNQFRTSANNSINHDNHSGSGSNNNISQPRQLSNVGFDVPSNPVSFPPSSHQQQQQVQQQQSLHNSFNNGRPGSEQQNRNQQQQFGINNRNDFNNIGGFEQQNQQYNNFQTPQQQQQYIGNFGEDQAMGFDDPFNLGLNNSGIGISRVMNNLNNNSSIMDRLEQAERRNELLLRPYVPDDISNPLSLRPLSSNINMLPPLPSQRMNNPLYGQFGQQNIQYPASMTPGQILQINPLPNHQNFGLQPFQNQEIQQKLQHDQLQQQQRRQNQLGFPQNQIHSMDYLMGTNPSAIDQIETDFQKTFGGEEDQDLVQQLQGLNIQSDLPPKIKQYVRDKLNCRLGKTLSYQEAEMVEKIIEKYKEQYAHYFNRNKDNREEKLVIVQLTSHKTTPNNADTAIVQWLKSKKILGKYDMVGGWKFDKKKKQLFAFFVLSYYDFKDFDKVSKEEKTGILDVKVIDDDMAALAKDWSQAEEFVY
eukprot:403361527